MKKIAIISFLSLISYVATYCQSPIVDITLNQETFTNVKINGDSVFVFYVEGSYNPDPLGFHIETMPITPSAKVIKVDGIVSFTDIIIGERWFNLNYSGTPFNSGGSKSDSYIELRETGNVFIIQMNGNVNQTLVNSKYKIFFYYTK